MVRLSIIVPIYNVEQWLERCLESLYAQGLEEYDFEVVVVNDGTKDNSMEVAGEFAASHANMKILHRENGGLSAARNTGLEHAQGHYVWFVDSDDFIEPDSVRPLLEYAETNQLDVMCFNLQRYFENGKILKYDNVDILHGAIMTGANYVCCQPMPPAAWIALYRREFLSGNNLRFKEGILHEDMEFTPRAYFLAKKIAYKDVVVVNYFQREGSIMKSSQSGRRVSSFLQICDSLHDFMTSNTMMDDKARNYFRGKIAFSFSQALSHWNKDLGISLKNFKSKPYYPLDMPAGISRKEWLKIRLANFSLPIYCRIKNIFA